MIKTIHGVISKRRLVNLVTDVRIFSTHNGDGSTTQYEDHPLTTNLFDRLFDPANYSNTSLHWSGTLNATVSLNHTVYTTLTGAGANVPNSGDYYSVEVTFLFVPLETGQYTFQIDSDDGSDLHVDGNFVVSYYDGHGTGANPQTGTYDMVSGNEYTLVARYQEYTGGSGLVLKWKRPSQGAYSLQTAEVFQPR